MIWVSLDWFVLKIQVCISGIFHNATRVLDIASKRIYNIDVPQKWSIYFFMHTDAKRKYVAKATRVRRASREAGSSLLDSTAPCRGNLLLKRRTGRSSKNFVRIMIRRERVIKMTRKEVRERYKIPAKILKEYENWGLSEQVGNAKIAGQYDDNDITRLGLIMTLHDIGFSSREVEHYMHLALNGISTQPERLAMLKKRRGETLEEIHCREKQIADMDYLRYKLQKGN